MKGSARVQAAARRILSGDDSISAANALESAILLDHGDDEDFEELVYVLAAYSPRGDEHDTRAHDVRAEIATTLGIVGTEDR